MSAGLASNSQPNVQPSTAGWYSPQEEWQPAEDEGAHDDAQRACGLVLPLHFD